MASDTLTRPGAAPTDRDRRSAPRMLYARSCDPEAALPGALAGDLRAVLRSATASGEGKVDDLQAEAGAWAAEDRARYRALVEAVDADDARAVLVRRTVLACAPTALVSGAWLQWTSGPGNADDPVTLRVLRVYAGDVGVGHPRASRGSAYLRLLRRLLLSEHAVPPASLTLDQRIPDEAFLAPAVLLAMSRRPDDFWPELLGADLCLRTAGLLPPLVVARALHPGGADWDDLDPGTPRRQGSAPPAGEIRAAIGDLAGTSGGGAAERAATGFAWALSALRRWSARLYADLDAARDPEHEMAELLRLRAREGAVYHRHFRLEGRPLSEWLQDSRTDPAPLLRALARSRLVKPGSAGTSALVTGLIGERGPMFRVFSEEDVTVIRRWIDALGGGDPGNRGRAGATAPAAEAAPLALASLEAPLEHGREPAGLREAYHLLQTRHDTVALRRFAVGYARGWLARSRHGIGKGETPLPERWDREGLRPWLLEQHDRHGQEFEEGRDVPIPSREALVDSTVQLAPLTLIDGSWLRGFTDYELASSEIGHFLFETYWDELGNGEANLNHPLLYREVLDEMDVHLPPTASQQFARWPGFRDRSLELPVYWLCIGRFPQTFMPEVLGLNLAMELSGVGGTYRRAHIALKKYRFSTRFVDIHNTIDNVATGHSAWAADAVDTHMASVPLTERDATWERVRAGYRSLDPPDGLRARLAGRRARRGEGAVP